MNEQMTLERELKKEYQREYYKQRKQAKLELKKSNTLGTILESVKNFNANVKANKTADIKAYQKAYREKKKLQQEKQIKEFAKYVVAEEDFYVPTELELKALALIKKEQVPLVDNYNNVDGEKKKEARDIMVNYIAESGVIGLIPSLPFTTWDIECQINDKVLGNHFIGVNRVVDTYNKSKSYLKENDIRNCTPYNGSMSDLIYDKDTDTFAHYILDYCCQLPTAMKQVEYIFHNDLVVVNGYIMMTFGLPIRSGKYADRIKNFSNYENNNESDDRGLSDKALENYFINLVGKNYKIMKFHYYQDTYPMVLVAIKRIK